MRIEFVVKDFQVSRQTAVKYLDLLAEKGFLTKHRSGRSNYTHGLDLRQDDRHRIICSTGESLCPSYLLRP